MSSVDYFYGKTGPTERQVSFRDASALFKLYGGAVGGGKSRALCAEGIRLSMAYAGNRGFMCRDEAKAFKETTLVTLLGLIYEIEQLVGRKIMKDHNKSEGLITFINKSTILYGGLGGRENHDRVKSMEIGWFAVDEASETSKDDIDMLESRLRWKLPSGEYPKFFGFYASNPEPGWIKDTFVTPWEQGVETPNRVFVQALPRDNQWLPDGYVDTLCSGKPDYWIDRYVNGSWASAEGQVYPQFDYNTHVFPNKHSTFEIAAPARAHLYPTQFAALDHGLKNPTCLLGFYVDKDGNVFVFDEYYSSGLVSEHIRGIKEKFNVGIFDYMDADPSIWNTTSEKDGQPWSVGDEYLEKGMYFHKASNSIDAGLNRVGEYLTVDTRHIHPILKKRGSPRLFISARCTNLIKEIVEYSWPKKPNLIREVPVKVKDHAVDTLRYGIMSRPSAEAYVSEPNIQKDSFIGTLKTIQKQHRINRFQQVRAYG